ncbi:MAG TPA: oxaloacetate decarboxylase subunit alpha [Aeromonadales bacterium]|nr:oxaloacetate decarboxylase subunit alpha [Aeromonadales bacterium]
MSNKLAITELVLRDAHQSLFATRLRIEDMLPIASKLDAIGYWSIETWGGATFDSCIRFLGEDPWERLRQLKAAMPNTRQQMLFRAQNILGYRHYADDVVTAFVERAAENGMDVFRIFDAMNDMRNLQTAVKATIQAGKHAQGTLSYTVSPVHDIALWLDKARQLEDMGVNSICIKDMAGLLKPYVAEELVTRLKETVNVPLALHAHATTGLSTATLLKAVEAGIDTVDTSISSMSMTYGHSATETLVSIFKDQPRDTGLDLNALEDISAYFREVRKKYAQWEGSLKGVDSRILVSQVPGGMLTNMESQLKEQGAEDKFDEVLKEIPKVRKDLGYIPLVTPTSQIVGTQAVLNVMTGERYKTISKETAGVLKGEYGRTPADVDLALQQKVLDKEQPISCRPADLLQPEIESLTLELQQIAEKENLTLSDRLIEDVLIYALFPQVGIKFIANRGDSSKFEARPQLNDTAMKKQEILQQKDNRSNCENYDVVVNGKRYQVSVSAAGEVVDITNRPGHVNNSDTAKFTEKTVGSVAVSNAILAPLAGNVFKLLIAVGDKVEKGQPVLLLEAMKMETEISSTHNGIVTQIFVNEGDAVKLNETLIALD